ncbi:unnamed protein product, partial [Strongylus vulgaris]
MLENNRDSSGFLMQETELKDSEARTERMSPSLVMELSPTDDECAIIQLPHVRLPGLCFVQGDYVVVDAPYSFEKGVKIGVG